MAKKNEELPIEEAPAVEETAEQKQWRLRAEESHKFREQVYRDAGLLKEGESLPVDSGMVNARCCG